MDVENRVQQLFDDLKKVDKQPVQKDMTSFELKNIEFKMNKHLQDKQKLKFKKVSIFNYEDGTAYDPSKFDVLVQTEIDAKFAKKHWSSMPMYMKWNLVSTYLTNAGITDDNTIADAKRKLGNGTLLVDFDNVNKSIKSIGKAGEFNLPT